MRRVRAVEHEHRRMGAVGFEQRFDRHRELRRTRGARRELDLRDEPLHERRIRRFDRELHVVSPRRDVAGCGQPQHPRGENPARERVERHLRGIADREPNHIAIRNGRAHLPAVREATDHQHGLPRSQDLARIRAAPDDEAVGRRLDARIARVEASSGKIRARNFERRSCVLELLERRDVVGVERLRALAVAGGLRLDLRDSRHGSFDLRAVELGQHGATTHGVALLHGDARDNSAHLERQRQLVLRFEHADRADRLAECCLLDLDGTHRANRRGCCGRMRAPLCAQPVSNALRLNAAKTERMGERVWLVSSMAVAPEHCFKERRQRRRRRIRDRRAARVRPRACGSGSARRPSRNCGRRGIPFG